MREFSIWHWLIVLLPICLIGLVYFTSRRRGNDPSYNAALGPTGFGGWLILLAIGQTLAPFRTLADLSKNFHDYKKIADVPHAQLAVSGELWIMISFVVFQIVVVVYMYKKSRYFPRL